MTVEECSSSSSDLSSSDEECSRTEGKPKRKKEDKRVGAAPPAHVDYFFRGNLVFLVCLNICSPLWLVYNVIGVCVRSQPGVSKLSSELSELVVYTRSSPFKGFEEAAKNPATDMSSFSESEALRHIKDSGMMCVKDILYILPTNGKRKIT